MSRWGSAFRAGRLPVNRLEAFSDGVIAIIITILVLEIRVPEIHPLHDRAQLIEALIRLLPNGLSYLISFLVVAVWWVAHHHLFELVERTDRGVATLTGLAFFALRWYVTAHVKLTKHEVPAEVLAGSLGTKRDLDRL